MGLIDQFLERVLDVFLSPHPALPNHFSVNLAPTLRLIVRQEWAYNRVPLVTQATSLVAPTPVINYIQTARSRYKESDEASVWS